MKWKNFSDLGEKDWLKTINQMAEQEWARQSVTERARTKLMDLGVCQSFGLQTKSVTGNYWKSGQMAF